MYKTVSKSSLDEDELDEATLPVVDFVQRHFLFPFVGTSKQAAILLSIAVETVGLIRRIGKGRFIS